MLSGEINKDSFAELFRVLSARRKNGLLRLSFAGENLRLILQEGIIVWVEGESKSYVAEVCRRLESAGKINAKASAVIGVMKDGRTVQRIAVISS